MVFRILLKSYPPSSYRKEGLTFMAEGMIIRKGNGSSVKVKKVLKTQIFNSPGSMSFEIPKCIINNEN